MPIAIALALAVATAADEGTHEPVVASQPDRELPYRAFTLSLSTGPAWLGGRLGVGGLALDDAIGTGAFVGAEVLYRIEPRLALGVYSEGTADLPSRESGGCGPGEGVGCDAAYTRFGGVARWSFHQSAAWEGWASAGFGGESIRIARYGPDSQRLLVQGKEVTAAVGLDWAATRRLGLGLFASASGGLFNRRPSLPAGGEVPEASENPTHFGVRAGIRGVFHAGSQSFVGLPRLRVPPLSAPRATTLSVEGRFGAPRCIYCEGLLVGVAAKARLGPICAGAFTEAVFFPDMDPPRPTADDPVIETRESVFLGGFAGAAADVGRRGRIELQAEAGLQRANAVIGLYEASDELSVRHLPFAGARLVLAFHSAADDIELGLAAFVREPLRSTCVPTSLGCEQVGRTVGLALQGSIAFARRGTEQPPSAPAPPQ